MVLQFYQLAEPPFGVTPDPRFLYLSETHREAMASVLYGVKAGRGFTALIAEPGMGKTTVLFNLLQQLGDTAKTAFLFQAHDTPRNFLRNLLFDLGMEDDGQDMTRMQAKLNECLMRETSQGKHFVVVVDESQSLDEPVLEVVRMLSNFETPREKLMHIILAGQPQLAAKLALPQMLQLRQRISIVARLAPLNLAETRGYIDHRLQVAGYRGEQGFFTDRALGLIAEYSGGIPRNISNICFNALSLGCAMQRRTINAAIIEEVLRDLDLAPLSEVRPIKVAPPAPVRQNENQLARLAEAFVRRLPKGWVMRATLAALVALLAGIGLTVVAKNPHGTASPAVSSPAAQAPVERSPVETQEPKAVGVGAGSSGDQGISSEPKNAPSEDPRTSDGSAATPAMPALESEVIRVGHEDTLYEICMERFGRYDKQVVQIVRELNPGLNNPRRLREGQEIRIPTLGSLMARTNLSVERLGTTSAAEARKP